MKRILLALILLVCALPLTINALQETPASALRLEITGVNATELPTTTITANVYDLLGQPVRGLTAENFAIFGELQENASIVSVENISDDNLPFATVLVIDVSDSMTGLPIAQAREAARVFVNSVADNDPVALVSFGSFVNVIQDFTTDKATLLSAIDNLQLGGRTALYQSAFEGITLGAISPVPRRAMVLLSDGAEYGGRSVVTPEQVRQEAVARGVPVYTIGLGFGADRSFLRQLSEASNARFYESPTPDQLVEIYREIAAILRSQYVITLNADLPLDGTEYDFGLRVTSGDNSAEASAVLRAPIPVPVIQTPELPTAPIEAPVTITANVLGDDPITNVTFTAGDQTETDTELPYSITIDPLNFAPGDYTLAITAEDQDGDVGSVEGGFSIAALPSEATISPDLSALGAIAEETAVSVTVSGQTPPTSIEYSLNGSAFVPLDESSTITLDPAALAAGENQLTVQITNEGGVTSTTDFSFEVARIAPTLSITGIENGQTFDEPFSFEVTASGQTPEIALHALIDNQVFEPVSAEAGQNTVTGAFTIDPMALAPGEQSLMISAADTNDMAVFEVITVNIAALPPTILISGLAEGDVLAEPTTITIDFISQTPVIHVAVLVDDLELAHLVNAPYSIVLDPLDYAPGDHRLRVAADNASSQHSTLDLNFTIAEGPSLTATALAPTPTFTHTATPDTNATETHQSASMAVLTVTAEAQSLNASATQSQIDLDAANAAATGTAVRATADAEEAAAGALIVLQTETAAARETADASATSAARGTQAAATAQQAIVNAQASATAGTTATAEQATQNANASATADADATRDALQAATQEFGASATADARSTSQAAAQQQAIQSTRDALATANVQARVEATNTADARATRNADATADAATATQLAALLLTETAAAETAEALSNETQVAQLNQTSEANVTQTANANITATAERQATIDTQIAAVGITVTPNESQTPQTAATTPAPEDETEEPRTSPTPQPTLTLIEAENPPSSSDLAPVFLVGIILLILLVALILLLLSRRRQSQR